MDSMFYKASAFNQTINTWDTANVTDMNYMFDSETAFKQNIGIWEVGALETDELTGKFAPASSSV